MKLLRSQVVSHVIEWLDACSGDDLEWTVQTRSTEPTIRITWMFHHLGQPHRSSVALDIRDIVNYRGTLAQGIHTSLHRCLAEVKGERDRYKETADRGI